MKALNICLIVIFNHRYDKNIPTLEKIYRPRFTNIKYLVPFYDGDNKDVIPVYESSYQFQGYLIQGLEKFYQDTFDYYVFIADDMIIAPNLNENNIVNELKLNDKSAFISTLGPLNSPYTLSNWVHTAFTSRAFFRKDTSYKGFLPSYEDALKRMKEYFGNYKEYYEDDFFRSKKTECIDENKKREFIQNNGKTNRIPYPLARGYSDFFVVDKSSIKNFSRVCGIFSAMNLFIEVALPTAMILTCDSIGTMADIDYIARTYWTIETRQTFENSFDSKIDKLLEEFEQNVLYYHPVKLSGWN